ncbi:bifunctional 3-(3-hydroxy-phenyl)propionate/3-hydroxycinnamic acid hydroxylase [Pseudomonas sp. 2FG]|uniref:bifunctional 3-(3-hydroxy-phenyl)propionate/3-hydroxycinnamic acid hydroxylase n=1 Tax=Pseudomonas sp. 2FG TaxID=2502191 RepID=UPI0010F7E589|nr:bifunctional 3-(3-hydroxy-phenyl)propionate/3-hydroxycinnamic acid hydroxylase [Pseudomonas sp. 2FG]
MDYDLIIVGMGPVGAMAANLAGLWGLKTLALDKADNVYENPRAMGLDHEVMRAFGNIGLADAIAPYVMPYRASHYLTTQSRLIKHIDAAKPPHALGWAPNYVFSQPPVERELRANIASFAQVTVELGAEVLAVETQGELAQVQVRNRHGEVRTVSAGYVLACDGGTSPIRARLKLRMEDLVFDEPWLVVDVMLKEGAGESLPTTNVQYCEVERPSTYVVGPGRHRRWEFMINPDETPADIAKPESIKHLISRWLDADDYDIWRASSYRFHALVLEQWRSERIFFAGDAAHMTPPFLAQGMCQGIRDAMGLIWKLALVQRGLAGPGLLDTYQQERAPHVRQTTEAAKEFGLIICERDPAKAAERDEHLLQSMNSTAGGTIRQSLIPGLKSGLIDDRAPAGELFPQPMVINREGVQGLLDGFTGQSFRIVIATGIDAQPLLEQIHLRLEGSPLPFKVVRLTAERPTPSDDPDHYQEVDAVLEQWMNERNCKIVIARPDHYVFGGACTTEGALALFERCLESLAS